jgi:MFS family permease
VTTVTDRRSGVVAFWLVAGVFLATMIGGALPTPLYPSYAQRFGFGPLTLTVVFAAYSVGALAALLGVGPSSDLLGRRPVLFAGLAVSAVSTLVFVLAGAVYSSGVPLLFVGRMLSGASVGIVAGTATAALADFAGPAQQLRASLTAAVTTMFGLGLGALVAGLLVKYVPFPLETTYVLHLVLVALALVAVWAVPESVVTQGPRRFHLQAMHVPPQARPAMVFAGTAGFAGFAVLGLFTAVTPALLVLLGHRNPALTGLVVFVVFFASALGQLVSARLGTRLSSLVGTGALVLGLVAIGLAIAQKSLPLLVVSGVVAGAAQGLSFRAALGAVTAASPVEQRGSVASTFFAICYLGLSLPVVGIGAGITAYGLVHTGEVFTGLLAALALVALVALVRTHSPASTPK